MSISNALSVFRFASRVVSRPGSSQRLTVAVEGAVGCRRGICVSQHHCARSGELVDSELELLSRFDKKRVTDVGG